LQRVTIAPVAATVPSAPPVNFAQVPDSDGAGAFAEALQGFGTPADGTFAADLQRLGTPANGAFAAEPQAMATPNIGAPAFRRGGAGGKQKTNSNDMLDLPVQAQPASQLPGPQPSIIPIAASVSLSLTQQPAQGVREQGANLGPKTTSPNDGNPNPGLGTTVPTETPQAPTAPLPLAQRPLQKGIAKAERMTNPSEKTKAAQADPTSFLTSLAALQSALSAHTVLPAPPPAGASAPPVPTIPAPTAPVITAPAITAPDITTAATTAPAAATPTAAIATAANPIASAVATASQATPPAAIDIDDGLQPDGDPKSEIRASDGAVPSNHDAPVQDLAFATRIQTAEPTKSQVVTAMASASSASRAKKQGDDSEAPAVLKELSAQTGQPGHLQNFAAAAYTRNAATPAMSPGNAQPAAAQRAEAPVPDADPGPKPAAPIKEIVMHVGQAGSAKVDVQVVQQAGEVHVAVRTGDSELAHGLRQGLPDLAGRLEEHGYRAETWRPEGQVAPPEAASDTRNTGSNSRNNDTHSQAGGSQQDGGRRNNNQSNQPRWVEDLESSMNGGASSGEFHGFGN
jgi:hypothetical protein